MGNNSSKDGSAGPRHLTRRHGEPQESQTQSTSPTSPTQQTSGDGGSASIYGAGGSSSRRGSRHDISFLRIGRDRAEPQQQTKPRETRQEREARRAERERQARLRERERSVREESVDGGFLVTLGTYTGVEDFSKQIVRQLQIERRLAPFWKGLEDHSDSWTEHQLVAAVRGLPIPAADDIPAQLSRSPSQVDAPWQSGDIVQPLGSTSLSAEASTSQLSSSHPATLSATLAPLGSSPLFRNRSKTLASLGGSKSSSEILPTEIRLPNDPFINGLPIEGYLYREPAECPICFLYYPPYLNKTRCCDQLICSECFVQIKRPDPHPPEHEQPGQVRSPEEEAGLLVSEVASCPFCKAPEFGITYDGPQFRRGLVYTNQNAGRAGNALSTTSSQTSFQSGERRRTISISASAPEVVTTDKVRPDWAKKLADARAHVLRRSAAATALHNAAYVLGSDEISGRLGLGRRRRSIFVDSPGTSGAHTPREGDGNDLAPGRHSSRRPRVEDLEDLMMMEAIRLSLAAEDERKRKEEKEKAKEDKKKEKEAKKEAKQLEKLSKKGGGSSSTMYKLHSNDSTSTWATTSMARSTSNLGTTPAILEEDLSGKGKAPAIQTTASSSDPFLAGNTSDSQRHLEESRANLLPSASTPIPMPGRRHHPRQLSNASSMASSFMDSPAGSYRAESPLPGTGFDTLHDNAEGSSGKTAPAASNNGGSTLEPMLNFQSLAAMIGQETEKAGNEHLEGLVLQDTTASADAKTPLVRSTDDTPTNEKVS